MSVIHLFMSMEGHGTACFILFVPFQKLNCTNPNVIKIMLSLA